MGRMKLEKGMKVRIRNDLTEEDKNGRPGMNNTMRKWIGKVVTIRTPYNNSGLFTQWVQLKEIEYDWHPDWFKPICELDRNSEV